jgi:hypothetical protein
LRGRAGVVGSLLGWRADGPGGDARWLEGEWVAVALALRRWFAVLDDPIVGGAQQLAVAQAGDPALAVWGDVVDGAAGGGFVAAGVVLAVAQIFA